MFLNTASVFPIQSYPMELKVGTQTIWSANYYLTFVGTPASYAAGPCSPVDVCEGSGGVLTIPFDTPSLPNFLERQGVPLQINGGASMKGPPFSPGYPPTVSASFTPDPNKQVAAVVYPGLGSSQRKPHCHRSSGLQLQCP